MEHPSSEPILPAPDSIDPPIENPVTKDLYFRIQPSKSNKQILNYVINHIFVPPRLPNKADGTPTLEAALLSLVSDLARAFTNRLEHESTPRVGWEIISKMLSTLAELHEDELTEDSINAALASMEPGDVLPILVAEQNAAVIFRRPVADPTILTLESFEVSPPALEVTSTEGKLRITYPSVGRLPAPVDPHTRKSLAQCIAYYAQNSMELAQSEKDIRKKNTQDPPSPRYITELLTGIVRGMSPDPERTYETTTFITKRINDHALCDREAEAAWRRSPMWLVIRVALQTTLHDLNMEDHLSYKAFMLYVLSCILGFALDCRRPDHLLYVMNAKLARRARKLSQAVVSRKDFFVMDFAVDMNKRASRELEGRWKAIQRDTTRRLDWEVPTDEELMDAVRLKLSQSVPYLAQVEKRGAEMRPRVNVKKWKAPGGENYTLRTKPDSSSRPGETVPSTLKRPSANPLERTIQLYDFEVWVADQLPLAVLGYLDMVALNRALDQYIDVALSHYTGNPERLSIAFLVILELWMSIDRCVIEWEPKLKVFSPEIPTNALESLLLPCRSQMERLSRVEAYLELRHRGSRDCSAIFYSTTDQNSFANWYVDQSALLREMVRKMEEEAERETRKKEEEMEALNIQYRSVKQQMDAAVCNKRQGVNGRGQIVTVHFGCPKCTKRRELKRMKFIPFERPLPANKVTLKCVVFELRVSKQFAVWRDATSAVLSACSGEIKEKADGKPWLISSYPNYKSRYSDSYAGHKLELAAYRAKYDSTLSAPVSLQHGIKPHSMSNYRIINQESWATNPFLSSPETSFRYLRDVCTLKVRPDGPYQSLQFSVSATTHTSNQIIASQDNCSTTITLHEYEAFGHLRSGHRLQWRNMLKELRRGVLSISHEDVHILFLQAMWQVEEKSNANAWCRGVHADAAERAFGLEALREMTKFLENIAENWAWSYACGVLIAMATRIISLTDEPEVQVAALKFLKRARTVTHGWIKEIRDVKKRDDQCNPNADGTGTVDEAVMKQRQALLVALVCASTFNVDDPLIDYVLDPAHDIAILVECRNVIYMNKPPALASLPFALRMLFYRDELLALRLLPKLARFISASPDAQEGLDKGIKALWDGYIPPGQWRVHDPPYERWYYTRTAEENGLQSVDVHFSLLDGALYVDNMMFGKLPDAYTQHANYLRLFAGSRVLETGPSTMLGMELQTKRSVDGWQVHFKMDRSDLIIRCRRDDQVFELLPESKLKSALPRCLLHDYAHWYDTNTRIIEIRPLSDPWTPNLGKNWSTEFQLNDGVSFSRPQEPGLRQFLVDPNHAISRTMHEVFSQLEQSIFDMFIGFNYEQSNGHKPQLPTISLPRYNLTFSLTAKGDLHCLSHRGYLVDPSQDVGTLYGLSNMLVLRSPSTASQKRRLVLPIGTIETSSDGNTHPNVTIAIDPDATSVKYHLYEVDDILGRLLDTTLFSRLYRLYLHSLTAHPLADPLLMCTGTEETVKGLAQGETFSFQSLLPEEIALLEEIGKLTPLRHLYSNQTKSMENVQRDARLVPTSEHYGFAAAVREIWDYWMSIRVLHPDSYTPEEANEAQSFLPKYENQAHKNLTRRSAARNVLYAPMHCLGHDAGAPLGEDESYTARDCTMTQHSIDREAGVFEMSKLVHEWRNGLDVTTRLLDIIQKWGQIPACQSELSLDYCSAWVDDSLESTWRLLYDICRHASEEEDRSQLAFVLSTLIYHNPEQRELCVTLLAFATNPIFGQPHHDAPPDGGSLDFAYGETPTESRLRSLVDANIVAFEDSHEQAELLQVGWNQVREQEIRSQYESRLQHDIDSCVEHMVQLREQSHVPPFVLANFDLFNKSKLLKELNTLFEKCSRNRAFFRHLDRLQTDLARIRTPATTSHAFPWDQRSIILPCERIAHVTWSMLFNRNPYRTLLPSFLAGTSSTIGSRFEQHYATLLRASDVAYVKHLRRGTTVLMDVEAEASHRTSALHELMGQIMRSIGPRAEDELMLARSGLWPRISPRSLLEQLTLSQRHRLSEPWKQKIVDFGQAISLLQRARRLSELSSQEHRVEYEKEANNDGQSGWDPLENPDWLLVELESNLLIRPVQAEIAMEMLQPKSNQNSVMQLNMGEGKSSVIVPIVAAALADQSRLIRVVVLKPLARQMFRLLCRTLGGLTNRRIFYLPIDRSMRPDPTMAKRIHDLFAECMRVGGVLVCQPEHILSFKLMTLETLSASPSSPLSQTLLHSLTWLEENARDILDESDEILSPKYQLIYTIGRQHAPDGGSMRWKLVQEAFEIVKLYARDEIHIGSLSIEVSSPQRFPQIRVFTQECGQRLLLQVAEHIVLQDLLPSFTFRHFSRMDRQILLQFITGRDVDESLYEQVTHICQYHDGSTSNYPTVLKPILLLRGLLGHGVLLTVLKEKRWRVDYGLDVSRSMLAVPYRAKDSPSHRAEFGHTDIAICLTCLSYYYEGLTDAQLEASFSQLFKADNPDLEYEEWIKDFLDKLSPTLHHLRGLNLEDPIQRNEQIFPQLRYSKAVIDFFLTTIVFPKYMKEFPHKLSASGWDLAQDRTSFGQLVTGFSGTNDNRHLLPHTISQVDMGTHLHTNAMVLHRLLQRENSKVMHLRDVDTSVRGMLELLRDEEPGARVLLDVGAQVLELQNQGVAKLWLEVDTRPEIEAAVFVDSKDELRILRRDGTVELLMSSPYLQQLGRCVVYLDEAHTRGTDLKLPPGSRAAVTLGPRLCKDKLVQGCMRMRKLGSTHSVFFLASTELVGYISAATEVGDEITSWHILDWSMRETLAQLHTYASLWVHQGFNFDDRNTSWERYKQNDISATDFTQTLKEKESHTLEDLYGIGHVDSRNGSHNHSRLKEEIQNRYEEFELSPSHSARMQEEHEREVAQEKEEERQIERPPAAVPQPHVVHRDVKLLVSTGIIPHKSPAIIPALHCLYQTTLGNLTKTKISGQAAFSHIWVTNDFARTIEKTRGKKSTSMLDDFLRPVEWILSSTKQPHLVVILSPFEANQLIDGIRQSDSVTLHTYGARTSRMMGSFEDLRSFMVPHRDDLPPFPCKVINELNLFAGQLYFRSMDAYEETCRMLGLYLKELPDDLEGYADVIGATCFVRGEEAREALGLQEAQFSDCPVEFLRKFIGLRRKGQGFLPTHLGQVLYARRLYETDFGDSLRFLWSAPAEYERI